jgi:hypothetical protein
MCCVICRALRIKAPCALAPDSPRVSLVSSWGIDDDGSCLWPSEARSRPRDPQSEPENATADLLPRWVHCCHAAATMRLGRRASSMASRPKTNLCVLQMVFPTQQRPICAPPAQQAICLKILGVHDGAVPLAHTTVAGLMSTVRSIPTAERQTGKRCIVTPAGCESWPPQHAHRSGNVNSFA